MEDNLLQRFNTCDESAQSEALEFQRAQFPEGFKIIRREHARFIEENILRKFKSLSETEWQYSEDVRQFMENLKCRVLDPKANYTRPKFETKKIREYFQKTEYLVLFKKLKACLDQELQAVKLDGDVIFTLADVLKHEILETGRKTQKLVDLWDTVVKTGQLQSELQTLGRHFESEFALLSNFHDQIALTLQDWKTEQRKIACGETATIKLEKMQLHWEDLCMLLLLLKNSLIKIGNTICNNPALREVYIALWNLYNKVLEMEKSLQKNGFIIENQPHKLSQTSKFSNPVSVRHLAWPLLNYEKCLPLQIYLVKESQAVACAYKRLPIKDVIYNTTPLTLVRNQFGTRTYSATFSKCKLVKSEIQDLKTKAGKGAKVEEEGPSRRESECEDEKMEFATNIGKPKSEFKHKIMEEKFYLFVEVEEFTEFRMFAISLPVTVVSHFTQDDIACITTLWDYNFRITNYSILNPDNPLPLELSYTVPESVPWNVFFAALSNWFLKETGRGLNSIHEAFLAKKFFGTPGAVADVTTDMLWRATPFVCSVPNKKEGNGAGNKSGSIAVGVCDLAQPKWKDEKVSFWKWIYYIAKLIKDHFSTLWQAGLIIGFLDKKEAEERLARCELGTFLGRFSDTVLGGISLPAKIKQLSGISVAHGAFIAIDLKNTTLVDKIVLMSQLKTIYTMTVNATSEVEEIKTPKLELDVFKNRPPSKLPNYLTMGHMFEDINTSATISENILDLDELVDKVWNTFPTPTWSENKSDYCDSSMDSDAITALSDLISQPHQQIGTLAATSDIIATQSALISQKQQQIEILMERVAHLEKALAMAMENNAGLNAPQFGITLPCPLSSSAEWFQHLQL